MTERRETNDFQTAQRICNQIRSGNLESVTELYQVYHHRFIAFANARLRSNPSASPEDVVSKFWIELLNGKAICRYKGINSASLYSFLLNILAYRILDHLRSIGNKTKQEMNEAESGRNSNRKKDLSDIAGENPKEPTNQETILQQFVHESLLTLSEKSPKDAELIKLHLLEGWTYTEIAGHFYEMEASEPSAPRKITDRIKKQFTRPETGSKSKLRRIMENKMNRYKLTIQDLLGE
jgi:RNA polymerase sigma-70 factor (ECF subfamily)